MKGSIFVNTEARKEGRKEKERVSWSSDLEV